MKRFLRKLWRNESGQDLAEYSLLMALIVIAAIGAVTSLGSGVGNGMQGAAASVGALGGGGGP